MALRLALHEPLLAAVQLKVTEAGVPTGEEPPVHCITHWVPSGTVALGVQLVFT